MRIINIIRMFHSDKVRNKQVPSWFTNISRVNSTINFEFVPPLGQTCIASPQYFVFYLIYRNLIAFAAPDESVPSTRWTRGSLGSGLNSETQIRGRREISIFSGRSFSPEGGHRVEGRGSFVSERFSKIRTPHANQVIYPGKRY